MSATDPLAGGVAVVTGAARGIGQGIARAAAARGMSLVIADIAEAPLQAFAAELEAAGVAVLAQQTDVSDAQALDRLADAAFSRFGAVRMLVNNAGIEMLGNSWELSARQWEQAIGINVLGPIQGVRAFAPRMIASAEPGYIINVASIAALSMMPVQTPYIVSKHAVLSFSECLYLEMQRAAPAIRVSAVLPGPVATQIFSAAPAGDNPAVVDHHRAYMEQMLSSYGMTPDEAGRTIIDQAVAGEFWIATHPEMMAEAAAARAAHLLERKHPALAKSAEAIL